MLKRQSHQNSNFLKIMLITFAIGLLVAVCIPIIMFFNLTVEVEEQQQENCLQVMSNPISLSAENYICENNALQYQTNELTCNDEISDLTRSDLVHLYQNSIEIGSDTYFDVDRLYGNFEYYCPDIEARQNWDTYRCSYNFIDIPSPVVFIFYDQENTVREIQSVSCPTTNNP